MITYIEPDLDEVYEISVLERRVFGVNSYSRDFLKYLIETSDFFRVAKDNDNIVGYACGEIVFTYGHLISIAVLKNYRNRGIGSTLLKMFIDFLKEKRTLLLYLEVSKENYKAIRFYLRRGVEIIDILPNYYPDGSDAYVMRLQLKYSNQAI